MSGQGMREQNGQATYLNGGSQHGVDGGHNPSEKAGCLNKAYDGSMVELDLGDDKTKTKEEEEEVEVRVEMDPWKVATIDHDYEPWRELELGGRVVRVARYVATVVMVLGLLYFFICSLDFLSSAFKLLGGKAAGKVFNENKIFTNPVAGLMMGVLVTVLVQSSSTSTSIIISMVGAGLLHIRTAIPMIMGANIGTSVTNTIVSMGQVAHKDEFRRAFAGATVHDMFNWMTVIILLPLELITGYLYHLSELIVKSLGTGQNKATHQDLLKVITKPFTSLIIQVNKGVITDIATKKLDVDKEGATLLKMCKDKSPPESCCESELTKLACVANATNAEQFNFCSTLNSCVQRSGENATNTCLAQGWSTDANGTSSFSCFHWARNETDCFKPTSFLFRGLHGVMPDEGIGAILLVVSLLMLCLCLILIVKSLNSVLKGPMATAIKKFVNADFPGKARFFTGYLAILLGAGFTILVQSSSIFTSTLTPLVGMGVIELHRMYPLTLGSNIGTTITGLLAAMAQDGDKLNDTLQVAFCHLFFNISGILIFYPFPFMRFPIPLAKFLGNTTAKYRWFALVYLLVMFFLFPLFVFGLSVPGWHVMVGVLGPVVLLVIVIGIMKCIQKKRPQWLPRKMQNWKWLPRPFRSLAPYDSIMQKCMCACCHSKADVKAVKATTKENDVVNGYKGNKYAYNEDTTTHL